MSNKSILARCRPLAIALAAITPAGQAGAADIDIYAATGRGDAPNVLFFFDNTSNWTRQEQAWVPQDSWQRCNDDAAALRKAGKDDEAAQVIVDCKDAIDKIFYIDKKPEPEDPRPWNIPGFVPWTSSQAPTQGTVQVRAFRLVLNALVCEPRAGTTPVNLNLGLAMFSPDRYKGTVLSPGDPSAFIYHAVQPLNSGACSAIHTKLNALDESLGNAAAYTAPQDSNYGAAFYEVFKYFGGYTNPTLAGVPAAGTPTGASGYGNRRFSLPTPYDDPAAFVNGNGRDYVSPIAGNGFCGKNYLVFVGNTYPKAEPRERSTNPLRFPGSLGYTPPKLDLITSDTDLSADEWSNFLARTDVSAADGMQPVYTYAVNVFNDKPDANQTKLLRSIATQGGVGAGSAYLEAGGNLYQLVKAFERILLQVSAVDSVFAATTLPVSTTTQGTFLNQVFVGMFRPDAQFSPRWVGNLKQYQLGFDSTGALDLLDADTPPKSAILGDSGFFSPLAESFWTRSDVFFTSLPSGTPPSASDLPDGYVVEKGGAAQWLRRNNILDSSKRNLYTLPSSPAVDTSLSSFPFTISTNEVKAAFDPATVLWVRGEANVTAGLGAEEFVGSYSDGGTVKPLGTSGARHSIHGDVLHSRPVAINYGKDASGIDDVVVFYGSNDGVFRAVDGRKLGSTAGHELWSFIAPEFYPMLTRQRAGTPLLHLPETDSSGKLSTVPDDAQAKDYGMDGPVGSYVLYNTGATSVKEAIIYMTMRRGGRSVYAIDVTDKTNPKFRWKIEGGVTTGFGELAQTWSMAKPIVYKSTSGPPPVVVVMGGGYDPAEDKDETGTPAGNRIYFIDGRDGKLLKAVETAYSVPADVTVVDTTGAGIPNRAYAADVRGNVYRIDMPTSDVLNPTAWSETKAVKVAELGGKVFYAPDVVVTSKFVVVLVGTGDREKPLLTAKISGSGSTEGFYLIKDTVGTPRDSAVKPSDLALVAEVNTETMKPEPKATSGNEFGCYIKLAADGEKVVNAPTTIAGVSYFGTNRPTPKDTLSCKAGLGEAYSYRFPLFCMAPTNTKLETGGLPPSPVAGIVEISVNGKPTQVPFIIGAGKDGSPFKPTKPEPPVPPVRKRQNWYIDNANR